MTTKALHTQTDGVQPLAGILNDATRAEYESLAYVDRPVFAAELRRKVKLAGHSAASCDSWIRAVDTALAAAEKKSKALDNQPNGGIFLRDNPVPQLRSTLYQASDSGISLYGSQVVCQPILPNAVYRNIETGAERVSLTFRRSGAWKTAIVPRSTLASASKLTELSDLGLAVDSSNAKRLTAYFTQILADNDSILTPGNSIGRLGWVGKRFVPFAGDFAFDGDAEFSDIFEAVSSHGAFGLWQEAIATARKNPQFRAALAASFVSPLLELFNGQNFFVNLWGPTGTGKTVALMAAASVWGNPRVLTRSWSSTSVALERTAGLLCNVPLCLDERETAQRADAGGLTQNVYMLANGISKGRGRKSGGIERLATWRLTVLTTGESPLTDDSAKGGAVNRALEIPVRSDIFTDPHGLVEVISKNYGHAGRLWLEYIVRHQSEIKSDFEQFQLLLQQEFDLTDKLEGALAFMAAADVHSAVAVFGLPEDDARASADEWIRGVAGEIISRTELDEATRAFEALQGWIAANRRLFETATPADETGIRNGLKCVGVIEGTTACVISAELKGALEELGFRSNVLSAWADRGFLIGGDGRGHGKALTSKRFVNGVRVRCYQIQLQEQTVESENFDFDILDLL